MDICTSRVAFATEKCLRTVFQLILSIDLLVLSTESYPTFDIAAQVYFVLSYQNLVMIHFLVGGGIAIILTCSRLQDTLRVEPCVGLVLNLSYLS